MNRLQSFSAYALDAETAQDVLGGIRYVVQDQVVRNRRLAQEIKNYYNVPEGMILFGPMYNDTLMPNGATRRTVYTYDNNKGVALKTVYVFAPGEPIFVW